MYKEPKPMREIHEIQERLHTEMKRLTPSGKIAAIRKAARRTENKYGLRLKKSHSAEKSKKVSSR
jgi:hypothetical protein